MNPEDERPRTGRVAVACVVVAGWLVLVWAAALTARTAFFHHRAVHVAGIVADPAPHPVIRFETPDGATFTFRQNGFISRPPGAAVPVAYDPADPAGTARAATFWAAWGTALWLLPAGLAFALFPWLRDRFGWHLERRW